LKEGPAHPEERRGARLWIIGNGAPHFAQAFAEELRAIPA
jgi:hypothetical protein